MGDRGHSGRDDPDGVEVERDLVERARQGDREAFAVLVHRVSDSLFAVAIRILRDTRLAEDALQNALRPGLAPASTPP
jgi:hypothetical protein